MTKLGKMDEADLRAEMAALRAAPPGRHSWVSDQAEHARRVLELEAELARGLGRARGR